MLSGEGGLASGICGFAREAPKMSEPQRHRSPISQPPRFPSAASESTEKI
jgi:hypothetical protein